MKSIVIVSLLCFFSLSTLCTANTAPPLAVVVTDDEIDEPLDLWLEGDLEDLLEKYNAYEMSDHLVRIDAYCSANLVMGRYRQFFACMEIWNNTSFSARLGVQYKSDKATDAPMRLVSGMKYLDTMPLSVAQGRYNRLLAEAWFQLGDYNKALTLSDASLAAYQQHADYADPAAFVDYSGYGAEGFVFVPGGTREAHWQSDILLMSAIAAQSRIKLGEKDNFNRYISNIESIHKTAEGEELIAGFDRIRKMYLNAIYLASGDYEKMQFSEKGASEYLEDAKGAGQFTAGVLGMAVAGVGMAFGGGDASALIRYSSELMTDGAGMYSEGLAESLVLREGFQNSAIAMKQQDWNKALYYLDEVLSSDDIVNYKEILQLALQQRGLALQKLNQPDEALLSYSLAIEIIEISRGNVSTEAEKLGFFGDKNLPYSESIKILLAQNKDAEAFVISERSRARALVDMLADSQARRTLLPNEKGSELLLASNYSVIESGEAPETSKLRSRALKRAKSPEEKKQVETQSLLSVQAYTASELMALVPDNEIVVEYIQADDAWYAFLVTGETITSVKLPAKNLETRINTFRKQLQQADSTDYQEQARLLYRDLIEPLGIGNYKAATLIPSGNLNYLPFSALMKGDTYLVEKLTLKLMPSATSMAFLRSRQGEIRLLALGNPTGDLIGAEAEVKAISHGLNNPVIVIREQATESFLKQNGEQFNVIHIASHGEFNGADPSASRLLLAGDKNNNGDLTMADIYELKLNANLVVLSACETGLNEVGNGEEIFGLTRGFLFAGSSNVIASLWKVDDLATTQLMQSLYKNIEHDAYAKSLQQAQLSLLSGSYKHPFYWAAFQLTGKG